MFDSNWFVRVEYLHYDFGNSGSSQTPVTVGVAPIASNAVTSFTSGHLTADVVRGGIAYKF
jgi:opacity protein-like surface antigen